MIDGELTETELFDIAGRVHAGTATKEDTLALWQRLDGMEARIRRAEEATDSAERETIQAGYDQESAEDDFTKAARDLMTLEKRVDKAVARLEGPPLVGRAWDALAILKEEK